LIKKLSATFDYRNQVYTVDCSSQFTWGFAINDKHIELDSSDLLAQKTSAGQCVLPFEEQRLENDPTLIVIGTFFLKHQCSIYDIEGRKIGIAPLK
jgi:hypothetical protein